MKDKLQFVIIALLGIVAFILFFGFVLSNIDPNNKLEAYTLAISFVGIFATFGGAYLGAKIAGNQSNKLFEKQIKIQSDKDRNKLIIRIRLSMDYIVKFIHHISGYYSKEVLSNPIYFYKDEFLNVNYTINDENNDFKSRFYKIVEKKPDNYIQLPEKVKVELNLFSDLIDRLIVSDEIVELTKEEQNQLFMFKQVLSNIDNQIKHYNKKYIIDVSDSKVEDLFIEYFVQLNVLLVDIQEWVLEKR
ncbi:hypothetical protein [Mammaliicoccus fleurettii]|uniref:hypothetical protein n=1 Tax=Mammaliicoccus fleurettii TaxID=150056 RepID=UPI001AACF651|nr:hypothetical protein [Mammaliicoccus fleurettii]MBO3062920.1 hypothetical protein [Mammaliicoccus fleurettii]